MTNNWRVDLYSKLLPLFQDEDQKKAGQGTNLFWNQPLQKWNGGGIWNSKGRKPVIENILYALEHESTKNLTIIDSLKDLIDVDKCPEEFLNQLSTGMGFNIPNNNWSAQKKREFIKSIPYLNKIRGTELSWQIFFRLVDAPITVFPLWKKDVSEDNGEYSREKYITEEVNESFSFLGNTNLRFYLGNINIKFNSLTAQINGINIRDRYKEKFNGELISNSGEIVGTINYLSGEVILDINQVISTDLDVTYERIIDSFPFPAARVDLEVFYVPDPDNVFGGELNSSLIEKILVYLDKVKPIQVKLRSLGFVLEFNDFIENFACDELSCLNYQKDIRKNEQRHYLGDFTIMEENGFLIDIGTEKRQRFEEIFEIKNLDNFSLELVP